MVGTVRKVGQVVVMMTTFFGTLLQKMGLSKPRIRDRPFSSFDQFVHTSNSIGIDPSIILGFNSMKTPRRIWSEDILIHDIANVYMHVQERYFKNPTVVDTINLCLGRRFEVGKAVVDA